MTEIYFQVVEMVNFDRETLSFGYRRRITKYSSYEEAAGAPHGRLPRFVIKTDGVKLLSVIEPEGDPLSDWDRKDFVSFAREIGLALDMVS